MSLEKNIERIADTLEGLHSILGKAIEQGTVVLPKPEKKEIEKEEPKVQETIKEAQEVETKEVDDSGTEGKLELNKDKYSKEERQAIIAELFELGVEFGAKQASTYLAKVLQKARNGEIKKPVVKKQDTDKKENSAQFKGVTMEEARELLKAYAATHGVDKAREKLNQFGASKISELENSKLDNFASTLVS